MKLDASHSQSFAGHGAERLRNLCRGLGLNAEREQEAQKVMSRFLTRWGDTAIGRAPRWKSDITDDHSPFEFSLAMDGLEPELRILVEAQAERPGLLASWEAGRALSRALAEEFGMPLDRLHSIEHLFAPTDPSAKFAIWHAVALRADSPLSSRSTSIRRPRAAAAREHRGAGHGPPRLPRRRVPRSGRSLDEIKYISLDMSSRPNARIKLYAAHHQATGADIEAALSPASYYVSGEAADFCMNMAGQEGPYTNLPVQTCLAYAANHESPLMGTVHFPVRSYAPNDEVVRDRILQYLGEPTAQIYNRAIESFANRPLSEGVGMQTYASLRQQRGAVA